MTKSYLALNLELPQNVLDFVTSKPGYTKRIQDLIIKQCEKKGVKA